MKTVLVSTSRTALSNASLAQPVGRFDSACAKAIASKTIVDTSVDGRTSGFSELGCWPTTSAVSEWREYIPVESSIWQHIRWKPTSP
jgi:3'-phosphoadenosine 5'-phosphosulfate sulfotransferase (PAPS reductase)/FAD synthetase